MTEIKSQIKGNFLGSKDNAEYELTNGQVWQQTRDYRPLRLFISTDGDDPTRSGWVHDVRRRFPIGIPVGQIRHTQTPSDVEAQIRCRRFGSADRIPVARFPPPFRRELDLPRPSLQQTTSFPRTKGTPHKALS